jgi:hypothetical protein
MTSYRHACALAAGSVLLLGASFVSAAPLYFQHVPNAFGTQPCSGGQQGCYTNYLRMTDIDGDGDLDLVLPNAGSSAQPLVIYLNDGQGNFSNASTTLIQGGYTGFARQVAIADINGDGLPDMYVPSANGAADSFFVSNGAGMLVNEAATRLPGVGSHSAAVRFGDVDNDGDLDLIIADRFNHSFTRAAHLYLNDGTGVFTEVTESMLPTGGTDEPYDLDLVDVDGDFDLDVVIDIHAGKSMLWLNDGTGKFTDASANLPSQSGLKYGPVACDVDGDGDLDLWFDNSGPGYTEQLLINDGTGHFTDETSQRVTGNSGSDDNGVACIDVDGDGDFDIAIASLGAQERVFINDGTGHFTHVTGSFTALSDSTLWFEFGDVNGDGRLDCATGQGESGSFLDQLYFGTQAVAIDTVPPKFRAVESIEGPVAVDDQPIFRFAVSDNATTDEGPRLTSASARVTLPGGDPQEVPATFMGGDLFRAVLPASPEGTVTVEACATDRAGNAACSTRGTYVVGRSPTTSSSSGGGGGAGSTSSGNGGDETTGGGGTSGDGGGGNAASSGGADGGCGCEVAGSDATSAQGWLLAAALSLSLSLARRRRATRPTV